LIRRALVLLLTPVICACAAGVPNPASTAPPPRVLPPLEYVALGASETFGTGTQQPGRDAFPQQLLGRFSSSHDPTLYNLGIPSETTAEALTDELPVAAGLHADVATVFFNVDDLVAGVPAADFAQRLDRIVAGLSADGRTRVAIASTPPIDQLPAATACERGSPRCPLQGVRIPPLSEVRALVAAYNAAIQRVASAHGAVVVDLAGAGLAVSQHPEYLSIDGFHPSTLGAGALAEAFYQALTAPRSG